MNGKEKNKRKEGCHKSKAFAFDSDEWQRRPRRQKAWPSFSTNETQSATFVLLLPARICSVIASRTNGGSPHEISPAMTSLTGFSLLAFFVY